MMIDRPDLHILPLLKDNIKKKSINIAHGQGFSGSVPNMLLDQGLKKKATCIGALSSTENA
jgi:hypothetical protein